LADPATKTSSGWLKLGQSFAGYTVDAFDAEREVLTLKRGSESLRLKLRDAKVQSGRATITGTVSIAADEIEGVRATLFLGEESAFPLKDGMTLHLKAERHSDGNVLYSARFVVLQPDGSEKTVAAPRLVALPAHRSASASVSSGLRSNLSPRAEFHARKITSSRLNIRTVNASAAAA